MCKQLREKLANIIYPEIFLHEKIICKDNLKISQELLKLYKKLVEFRDWYEKKTDKEKKKYPPIFRNLKYFLMMCIISNKNED